MAKLDNGYMGGFSGTLGPAVGYMWNGKWCVRSRPAKVNNPRTAAQQDHRLLFREEVRLAARMAWCITRTLREPARAAGMTAYNLFVSVNQPAFSLSEGELAVDYSRLAVSLGPVAPVGFRTPTVDAQGVLHVDFERNPRHLRADPYDEVHLFLYCPAQGTGYMTAPVYRNARSISVVLPKGYAEKGFHIYGVVGDAQGRWSESVYVSQEDEGGEEAYTESGTATPRTASEQVAEREGTKPRAKARSRAPEEGDPASRPPDGGR